ncbi:MarR family winged helix-turn-helix transcriptional regulator [Senegalia massiliensis]|uniref:MarR family transcriptional regulator n=1 Tax=Senegalia massiliensis TaxID=1720316 RepID=A0A845QW33_9CLOT|nr:MarR family transcriptional regulator [Senegalia massiliensis]NBI05999.1 MarR family transcriptional regulator [Senegalia massiliensis]
MKNNGISIVKLLKNVMDTMKRNIEDEFKEMNLTGPQGMLIGILSKYEEMKISDISQKMGLSNSTVSGIVDRMEKQGYIERIRSKEDRRVVHVKITPSFKEKSKNHFSKVENKIDDIIKNGTKEEIEKIYEGLETLKKVLDRNEKK